MISATTIWSARRLPLQDNTAMDEDMDQLVESVKERGVITPVTLRAKEAGQYRGHIIIESSSSRNVMHVLS